jgi:hypothetical protein
MLSTFYTFLYWEVHDFYYLRSDINLLDLDVIN